ncbi:hypothetical protein TSMEX_011534 [Taenia solium]|eukprot:TsM_001037800 transcript=TsM_001037800 gene=TsM_001037800
MPSFTLKQVSGRYTCTLEKSQDARPYINNMQKLIQLKLQKIILESAEYRHHKERRRYKEADLDVAASSHSSILPEELQMRVINEVKFVDLNRDFNRVDEESGKAILKLNVFHPEASVLRRVPVTPRPLIALMLNSDLLRKIVLFLEEFCPDFVEAFQVLKILGLDQGIPTLKEPIKSVEEVKMPKRQ